MRVALLLLSLAACEPALELPERPSEHYVANGAKWLQRDALDRRCGCVGTLPNLPKSGSVR